ncbi:sulfotransferase [Rhizobium sp. TRM96647]|uniref:sulfotransferase n=1 Tax=unclassified Rhizobium TaxID=2613769 RepID=UPI0021E8C700|nr:MULTISPECIES: sulfotransferase [unclassified Rhizobium]MCV3737725.1 sulfotransferase [Rhizobium sp. TRM96647]MCV3759545.1 sulfotransferase [Rhizobium sp. TRM96650]
MSRQHIVIAGPPRTGTRFLTDALNKHPEVAIQGEIPSRVLDHALRFMTDAAADYKRPGHVKWSRVWDKSRVALFEDIIAATQKRPDKSMRSDRHKAIFTGFKLPAAVNRLEALGAVYGNPKFVLCIREFAPYHLSCVSRWPEKTIQSTAKNYLAALGSARKAIERGDQVFVFPLERLKTDGVGPLRELGEFLGLSSVDAWLNLIDPSKKANEAEKFTKNKRTELTDEEKAYVEVTPLLHEFYTSLASKRGTTKAA